MDISNLALGQLFILGVKGPTLSSYEKKMIEEESIGGIILFSKNYESPEQLAELISEIQYHRKGEYPLYISVDHEGGRVIRFKKDFTQFPAMILLAELRSPKLIYTVHHIMASELKACGINLSYSPCCDILLHHQNDVIGDRAFGKDEETVSKYVSAAVRGLQTGGVLACGKHFPGHGFTDVDSHDELPHVDLGYKQLLEREFIPFEKVIKAKVEFVMIGHLMVKAFGEDLPTSLNTEVYECLKDTLNFRGLAITDDLEMGAIEKYFKFEEVPFMALSAGSDLLIYRNFERGLEAIEGLRVSIQNNPVLIESFEKKIDKIRKHKKMHLWPLESLKPTKIQSTLNSSETKIFLEDIYKKMAMAATTNSISQI